METWTLIISAAALVISLYTYFAHDRKLKQQERLINSYQLKQLQEEEQANKKPISARRFRRIPKDPGRFEYGTMAGL